MAGIGIIGSLGPCRDNLRKEITALRRTLERYAALLTRQGIRHCWHSDRLFRTHGPIARPVGPIAHDEGLTTEDADHVLQELGAKAMWWTDGVASGKPLHWFAMVLSDFVPADEMSPKKRRYNVQKALKACMVRRLSVDEMLSDGYRVYTRAYERYRAANPPWSPAQFAAHFAPMSDFEDITHHWGAFCDGQLAAVASMNVYNKVEATRWMAKLDPAFAKQRPMYALIYRMNEYYLGDQGFAYVNDGWRSVSHETSVQDFLVTAFGYERWGCHLHTQFRFPIGLAVKLTYPIRRLLGPMDQRLRTVYCLEEAARRSTEATK